MDTHYVGTCFCGTVKITTTGAPAAMGYCHCASCRHWSAGPVNAFTLWDPAALKVTAGADSIETYHLTPASYRKWCGHCGGHLFTEHPGMKLVDIYAAVLPELPFKPGLHVNYVETVLPMKDGLPKFRGFPKEVGGSGERVPE
jgi:hypothetical protein